MSKYSLIINFESLDELVEFTTTYNKIYNKAEQKIIKTSNDKRGSKTIGLHLRAKQYRLEHPELSYRQCLIEVSKQQEQDLKPELIEVEPEEPNKKPFEIYEENLII
jgi:hypothetical protein